MNFTYNSHIIKAITIKQPYASLIVNGIKDIENRTWKRKMSKDVCKNWLFVHAASKPASKKRLAKSSDEVKEEINKLGTLENSAIIGMMHIHSIGECKKSVHKNSWASGPNCWYIDAVVPFKIPIPTVGSLGQWAPDTSLFPLLKTQIDVSMYNIIAPDGIDFVKKGNIYYIAQRGRYMTWKEVIKSLKGHATIDTLKYKLIRELINVPYEAYLWECDQVDMKKPFRFAVYDSQTLAKRTQDTNAFNGKINCHKNVIAFPSLSKDTDLVVPCRKYNNSVYTSISTFSRTVPIKQQVAFWQKVGKTIGEDDWVSTSGLGVSWLHVRVEKYPKYYHGDFLNTKSDKQKMEDMIENFEFGKHPINVIYENSGWKYTDLMCYYMELLPKNIKLILLGKKDISIQKAEEVELEYETSSINWKTGAKAGKKRNIKVLKGVDLVTVFGKQSNVCKDLVKQAKSLKIPVLEIEK
jgi:hypothetical protein